MDFSQLHPVVQVVIVIMVGLAFIVALLKM